MTSADRLDGRGARTPDSMALVVHALSLFVGGAVLLWANRGQWFTFDEWDFLAQRGVGGSELGLLQPHSEHWSTLPILAYRALFGVFGLRSYVPYVVLLVALHLVGTHLLFRVMRRSGVDPLLAALLLAVFAVLGAGAENLLWAFQIGFVGSVVFGLAQLLVATTEGGRGRRVAGWALGAAALMSSGIGVTMVALTGYAVAMRQGVRQALAAVVAPAMLFVAWLAGPGRSGFGTHQTTLEGVLEVPRFVMTGLTSAVDRTAGIAGAGAVVVIAVLAYVVRRADVANGPVGIAAACAGGSVTMLAVAGVGRASMGLQVAESSRYSYIAVALLLPVLGLILTEAVQRRPHAHAGVAVVLALVALHNVGLLRTAAAEQRAHEQGSRRQLLAAASLVESGERLLGGNPEPKWAPNLYLDAFREMVADGDVPSPGAVDPVDRLAAATQLQLAVSGNRPESSPAAAPVLTSPHAVPVSDVPGCVEVTASAGGPAPEVRFNAPGWLSLRSTTGGPLRVRLRDASSGITGPERSFDLPPAAQQWLEVARPASTIALDLPPGSVTRLCTNG